jgi:acetyl esterase
MIKSAELHPEIQTLFEQMGEIIAPRHSALSPAEARRFSKQNRETASQPEAVHTTLNFDIVGPEGPVPVRVYVPTGAGPFPALIYFHGGGWVLGDTDLLDPTCRAVTNQAECVVISVDYRLAPEDPFPAGLIDCYASVEWVSENAVDLNINPDKIAIGGDSAGGNLAASVTHMTRDRNGPELAHQVLVYPVTDYSFSTDSWETNGEGGILTKELMKWFWSHYLEYPLHRKNPYVSVLRSQDFSGLPPATILTGGFDPLRDEGIAYADRLEQSGVSVNHINYEDIPHGIIQLLVDPDLQRARDMVRDICHDLNTSLS